MHSFAKQFDYWLARLCTKHPCNLTAICRTVKFGKQSASDAENLVPTPAQSPQTASKLFFTYITWDLKPTALLPDLRVSQPRFHRIASRGTGLQRVATVWSTGTINTCLAPASRRTREAALPRADGPQRTSEGARVDVAGTARNRARGTAGMFSAPLWSGVQTLWFYQH